MSDDTSVITAPAILSGTNTGRKFSALLSRRDFRRFRMGPATVEEVELLPLGSRQVLVRVEASAPAYAMVPEIVDIPPPTFRTPVPPEAGPMPVFGAPLHAEFPDPLVQISNFSHVGVVEEVGAQVTRLQKGDRVVVGATSHCGVCYHCVNGAPYMCQFTFGAETEASTPVAVTSDGSPVIPSMGIGGFGELSVVHETYCCPVWTDVPPVQLSLLGDNLAAGLAVGMSNMQITPGSDVVIFGAGPVGLSAVMSARITGATQIIVVEPIKARRDLALKFGATSVLDPNVEGAGLVEKIQSMCTGPTTRREAGGRPDRGYSWGADFSISTVGLDWLPPATEVGPDPTGVLPMLQAFSAARSGGNVMFMGVVLDGAPFNPMALALMGKKIWPGQQAGIALLRDIPKFVRLIERGLVDAEALIDGVYPLEQAAEATRLIGDRTKVQTVVSISD